MKYLLKLKKFSIFLSIFFIHFSSLKAQENSNNNNYWITADYTVVGLDSPSPLGKGKINIPPKSCIIALDYNSFTKVVFLSDTIYINKISLHSKISKDEYDLFLKKQLDKKARELEINQKPKVKVFSCDDIDISINQYTKIKKAETGFKDFSPGTYNIYKEGGIIYFYISVESYTAFTIDKGEIFYLKLEDGTILKFPNTQVSFPDYSRSNNKYSNSILILLKYDILNKLSNFKITGMKYYINEIDLEPEESSIIMESFKCLKSLK